MPEAMASKPIIAVDRKRKREVRYQTKERLGEGASGRVYAAVRLPDGADVAADDARRVAIKLSYTMKWKGHLADEARLLDQLQRTAPVDGTWRPVRVLSGPEPLEVEVHGGDPAALIELEYLDGLTLRAWLDEWNATEHAPADVVDEVLTCARQLAEALVQLQTSAGGPVIHRDLKPENLMRTSRGLRVFDFNVSRPDEGGPMTSHVGTNQYMAPEVLYGRDYDGRSDLYGVGVVLWELVHRRSFDRHLHADTKQGDQVLLWPTEAVKAWPASERQVLDALLPELVCAAPHRLRSGKALLERVEALEAPRRAARKANDPLAHLDMIQVLAELRPSGLAAVVSDTTGQLHHQSLQDFLRDRMQVEAPLEDWLVHEVTKAATTDQPTPTLFVLAGNAGDGKSHLLARLRRRLSGRREVLDRLKTITDATHALQPDASQMDRLEEFFRPFADRDAVPTDRVHLIAINTGMVIRFFEHAQGAQYQELYQRLQHALGLLSGAPEASRWRVEVVNLDLRDLLSEQAGRSFAERMLDRLDPENADGIAGRKWAQCRTCSAFALCPVAFNLRALKMPQVRSAVLQALRRVALDTDVHLSPRNLWGFLYRLATGGVERYDERAKAGEAPCDVVRRRVDLGSHADGQWLLEGHFSELLFQQAGGGAPWSGLVRHDPAFSAVLDHLHTRLSVKTELDNDPVVVAELGGTGRTLAGLSLDALTSKLPETGFRGRRRDAAVRRQVLFHKDTFEKWAAADGGRDFERLLTAYDDFSRSGGDGERLGPETRKELKQLRSLVQDVFLKGNGREINGVAYLRVSQPNVRARTELLVRADRSALDEPFALQRMVVQDLHVVAHRGRERLLELLGYRPNQVTLRILGVRVTVDLELFEFLRRVDAGLKPSMRDLSQFQALLFIGERVGNHLAKAQSTRELFVYHGDAGTLFRLGTDDFGAAHLEPAR
jgi:serine/threonine protein kinase